MKRRRLRAGAGPRGDVLVLTIPRGASHDELVTLKAHAEAEQRRTGLRIVVVAGELEPRVLRGRR